MGPASKVEAETARLVEAREARQLRQSWGRSAGWLSGPFQTAEEAHVHFLFWRCRPAPSPPPPPRRMPSNERPNWATQPTEVFPTNGPGRAGNPTPAQRWRAGGWRNNGGPR